MPWVLMGKGDQSCAVRAAAQGPLPGLRQSNNRAEIYSLLHALRSTGAKITFWSDSEILCKGWRRRRFAQKRYHRGNRDLWRLIGVELQTREGAELAIDLRHIQSHLDYIVAMAKGYAPEAWHDNAPADERAGAAAEAHQLPAGRLSCFEWMRATGHLVRQRIIRAQMDSFVAAPPWTWHERQVANEQRAVKAVAKQTFAQLVKASPHVLTKSATGG